jgi:hypothetical protein
LQKSKSNALIFASGSAIAALAAHHITPHFGVALDPSYEEFDRLRRSNEVEFPLLYSLRLCSKVFDLLQGPYIFSGDLGSHFGLWLEEILSLPSTLTGQHLDQDACSVTMLSLALAQLMGCNPIIFSGVDLSFVDQRRYACGVLEGSGNDLETKLETPELKERSFIKDASLTNIRWVMEALAITKFAQRCPDVTFYNTSSKGLSFEGIAKMSLQKVMEKHGLHSFDMEATVHCHLQNSPALPDRSKSIAKQLKKGVREALKAVHAIVEILEKCPKERFSKATILLERLEWEESWAYEHFFFYLPHLASCLAKRELFEEGNYDHQLQKWKLMKDMLQCHIAMI